MPQVVAYISIQGRLNLNKKHRYHIPGHNCDNANAYNPQVQPASNQTAKPLPLSRTRSCCQKDSNEKIFHRGITRPFIVFSSASCVFNVLLPRITSSNQSAA